MAGAAADDVVGARVRFMGPAPACCVSLDRGFIPLVLRERVAVSFGIKHRRSISARRAQSTPDSCREPGGCGRTNSLEYRPGRAALGLPDCRREGGGKAFLLLGRKEARDGKLASP